MSDRVTNKNKLATYLAEHLGFSVGELEKLLTDWELVNAESPHKVTRKTKKSVNDGFIYPSDKNKSSTRQKIPNDTYQNLTEDIRQNICDRNLKSAGEIFYCGAFPVVENNRCEDCKNVKKPKTETKTLNPRTLNTGLNGSKMIAQFFATNHEGKFVCGGYKVEDIIFEKVEDSQALSPNGQAASPMKAVGYIEGVYCNLSRKGEIFELPKKLEINDLTDTHRKNLGRYENMIY